jgi:CHASE2 domain-containing sensor protein
MTKKEYFRINNYTILTWYFILLFIATVGFSINLQHKYFWIPPVPPLLGLIVIRWQGTRAYKNYLKVEEQINNP